MKHRRAFSHIPSLDGVRALAVLTVFLHHTLYTSLSDQAWPAYVRTVADLFHDGNLGVDLFFVLSGYLITTLLLKERRKPWMYHDFYIKRVFRILPALIASLAFGYLTGYLSGATVLLGLLFVVNYAHLLSVPVNGPFWSLAVEEQFYILWPVLVRRATFHALHRVLLAVIVIEPFVRYWAVSRGHGTMYYTYLRADGLAWGAWLGASTYYHRIYADAGRAFLWWKRYGRPVLGAGVVAMGLQIAAARLGWLGMQGNTTLLTAIPILFTGAMGYLVSHPKAPISRALSVRPLAFFGDISYGLYLIHMTVIELYDRRTGWAFAPIEPVPYVVRFGAIFAISVGLATLSLYFYERPLMRKRKRFLQEPPSGVRPRVDAPTARP